MNNHDRLCRSYYPNLTKIDTCMWCNVLFEARKESAKAVIEYFKNHPHVNKIHVDAIVKQIIGTTE